MVCIRGEARAEVAEWQSEVMMAPTATKTRQSVAREDSTDLLGPMQFGPRSPWHGKAPLTAHEAGSGRGWEIFSTVRDCEMLVALDRCIFRSGFELILPNAALGRCGGGESLLA